jgi:hypothetical protein
MRGVMTAKTEGLKEIPEVAWDKIEKLLPK